MLAVLLQSGASGAGELDKLSVTEQDGEYRLHITRVLDAPADYVHAVITDYRNASRINPAITEVEVLPSAGEGVIRVRNRTLHWIGPFCLKLDWVGDITERQHGQIDVSTVPELSSFESGRAYWKIVPVGYRTVVDHASSFRPKFFIPPVLGGYLIKKYVQRNTLATFNRIECRALIKQQSDRGNDARHLKELLTEGKDCSTAPGVTVHEYVFQERE